MLKIESGKLIAGKMTLKFPAVRFSINGKIYEPAGEGSVVDKFTRLYQAGDVAVTVRVEEFAPNVWRKFVTLQSSVKHPTPDWVETDRQTVDDKELRLHGYFATTLAKGRVGAEDAGGSLMPGCGYPLIGKNFFAGIEHPAAFAKLEKENKSDTEYYLRQHPVWNDNNTIELAAAVFSMSSNAEKTFRDYLDMVRRTPQEKPFFSLCSFWSDPYLGNYEYLIAPDNYCSFVDAFYRMGITPDVYTLDAGWQDRQSIYKPKASFNGEAGLWALSDHIRKRGSAMGLWASHNGPMGIAPEFARKAGYAVGSGESSTYCGDNYVVLMDKRFAKDLNDRLVELAAAGSVQFKMDWENDCATNSDFDEVYPTRDHVREASINVQREIADNIYKANPETRIRQGWWPSPWWLMHSNHIFLPDSGDSEYSTLPSRTQRDTAATYRDTLYYSCFIRDNSAYPLDAIDNHEFPHALRNPFHEEPGTTANILMLAILRGCSYLPMTLQPEALEPWFVELLKHVMKFARSYGKMLYTTRSKMFGGCPNKGDIYGFSFDSADGTCWCAVRNPSAMPQEYTMQDERSGIMAYPYFSYYKAGEKLMFAPHEIKLLILSKRKLALPFEEPFQAVEQENGKTEFRFPAHLDVAGKVAPMVGDIYRINQHEIEWNKVEKTDKGVLLMLKLRLPYRMRGTTFNVEISGKNLDKVAVRARSSRYATEQYSAAQLPVTHFAPGCPGSGITKNPDTMFEKYTAQFAFPCAEGGEAYYSIFADNVESVDNIKLSVSGSYAPSRDAISKKWDPKFLNAGLPPMYPDGFPMAVMLEIPDPESLVKK